MFFENKTLSIDVKYKLFGSIDIEEIQRQQLNDNGSTEIIFDGMINCWNEFDEEKRQELICWIVSEIVIRSGLKFIIILGVSVSFWAMCFIQ